MSQPDLGPTRLAAVAFLISIASLALSIFVLIGVL